MVMDKSPGAQHHMVWPDQQRSPEMKLNQATLALLESELHDFSSIP